MGLTALIALPLFACSGDVEPASTSSSASGSGGGNGSSSGDVGSSSGGTGGSGGGSSAGAYSASNLFTHVPRFIIFKADPERDVCFRLWVEGYIDSGIGIESPSPWAITQAEVTNHASDCALSNGYPIQPIDSAPAVSGTGSLTVDGTFPCSISLHGTISFSSDANKSWIPAVEALDVDMLPVDGGCG